MEGEGTNLRGGSGRGFWVSLGAGSDLGSFLGLGRGAEEAEGAMVEMSKL